MTLRQFVRANRTELDEAIRHACPNVSNLNDEERRQWVLNSESLYLWARSEGVSL